MGEIMCISQEQGLESPALEECRAVFRATQVWFPDVAPKSRAVVDEISRLRNYIQVVDPPIAPDMGTSWAKICQDRLIPSLVVVRMMARAEEKRKAREARKDREALVPPRRDALRQGAARVWLVVENWWAKCVAGVVYRLLFRGKK